MEHSDIDFMMGVVLDGKDFLSKGLMVLFEDTVKQMQKDTLLPKALA